MFTYVNVVASVAAYVSITHDIRSQFELSSLIYRLVKDAAFGSDITQTAIRRGCAAAKNIYEAEMSPHFKNGVILFKVGKWKLNPLASMYLIEANAGSRTNPIRIRFLIPKRVGDMMQKYRLGELWITPTTYTITYSKAVKAVRKLDPAAQQGIHNRVGIRRAIPAGQTRTVDCGRHERIWRNDV